MKKYLTIVFYGYGDMLIHEIIEAEDQADHRFANVLEILNK